MRMHMQINKEYLRVYSIYYVYTVCICMYYNFTCRNVPLRACMYLYVRVRVLINAHVINDSMKTNILLNE